LFRDYVCKETDRIETYLSRNGKGPSAEEDFQFPTNSDDNTRTIDDDMSGMSPPPYTEKSFDGQQSDGTAAVMHAVTARLGAMSAVDKDNSNESASDSHDGGVYYNKDLWYDMVHQASQLVLPERW
jgi:hypothetical protein